MRVKYGTFLFFTTAQVAARYGVTARRILAIAQSRGVVSRRCGRYHIFDEASVPLLRPGTSGRPPKVGKQKSQRKSRWGG